MGIAGGLRWMLLRVRGGKFVSWRAVEGGVRGDRGVMSSMAAW